MRRQWSAAQQHRSSVASPRLWRGSTSAESSCSCSQTSRKTVSAPCQVSCSKISRRMAWAQQQRRKRARTAQFERSLRGVHYAGTCRSRLSTASGGGELRSIRISLGERGRGAQPAASRTQVRTGTDTCRPVAKHTYTQHPQTHQSISSCGRPHALACQFSPALFPVPVCVHSKTSRGGFGTTLPTSLASSARPWAPSTHAANSHQTTSGS